MEITVSRVKPTRGGCIGEVRIDGDPGRFCWSLEDTVRADPNPATPENESKVYGETAIPGGRYRLILSKSKRFNRITPELLYVPGYTGIRIHPGNTPADTLGCILVGDALDREGANIAGGTSRPAFERLMAEIEEAVQGGEEIWLTVENSFSV